MPNKFAIIDLETTGGKASMERVIEVAIAVHDGEKVVAEYESLVNPERSIPYNITRITGIDNTMVVDAPKFFEIAKKIVEMTEDCIFVAHNVRFDYSFLSYEFKRLGYTYTRKQLCTVKMSRKAFPKLPGGHSLGNLIKQFGIKVKDRHRAMADVHATVEVFEKIIKLNGGTDFETMMKQGIRETILPPGMEMSTLDGLPQETGVYYFHNEDGDVVYVGKSIHIKRRAFEHFRANTSKAALMERHVRDISYELTGSELVALLLESHEIREIQPIINKAQRGKSKPTGILTYENQVGYICFSNTKITSRNQNNPGIIATYDKPSHAAMAIYKCKSTFGLCDCLLDGKKGESSCIYQQIGQCPGAGVGLESKDDYNERALEAREMLEKAYDYDCIIIDEGRNPEEIAIVLVEEGRYQGYGYCDASFANDINALKSAIGKRESNSNIPGIIRNYIATKESITIIRL